MFELLAELFSRSFKKFKAAQDGKEKRAQLINIIFWTVCAFISLILYLVFFPNNNSLQSIQRIVCFQSFCEGINVDNLELE